MCIRKRVYWQCHHSNIFLFECERSVSRNCLSFLMPPRPCPPRDESPIHNPYSCPTCQKRDEEQMEQPTPPPAVRAGGTVAQHGAARRTTRAPPPLSGRRILEQSPPGVRRTAGSIRSPGPPLSLHQRKMLNQTLPGVVASENGGVRAAEARCDPVVLPLSLPSKRESPAYTPSNNSQEKTPLYPPPLRPRVPAPRLETEDIWAAVSPRGSGKFVDVPLN